MMMMMMMMMMSITRTLYTHLTPLKSAAPTTQVGQTGGCYYYHHIIKAIPAAGDQFPPVAAHRVRYIMTTLVYHPLSMMMIISLFGQLGLWTVRRPYLCYQGQRKRSHLYRAEHTTIVVT
jgi:hypothetical protein